MKRTSNFNFKISIALVVFTALSLYANDDGMSALDRARAKLKAAGSATKNRCAEVVASVVLNDIEARAAVADRRADKVKGIVERLFTEVSQMGENQLTPTAQNQMMETLINDIGGNPDFQMLQNTMGRFSTATAKITKIEGKFAAIMKKLDLASAKAGDENATSKVGKALRAGMNFLRSRKDTPIGEILEEIRDEVQEITEQAKDTADEHYDDLLKMQSVAKDHLKKAEDLREVMTALDGVKENLIAERASQEVQVSLDVDPVEIISRVQDNLSMMLNIHSKIADEMLDASLKGFAVNDALKQTQLLAAMATVVQFPKLAAMMSNALALKTAQQMMAVTQSLNTTVQKFEQGIGRNFQKLTRDMERGQRELLSAAGRGKGQAAMDRGMANLERMNDTQREQTLRNNKELAKSIADKQKKLAAKTAGARAGVVVGKLLADSDMQAVLASTKVEQADILAERLGTQLTAIQTATEQRVAELDSQEANP